MPQMFRMGALEVFRTLKCSAISEIKELGMQFLSNTTNTTDTFNTSNSTDGSSTDSSRQLVQHSTAQRQWNKEQAYRIRSGAGKKQGQSGGNSGIKAHCEIQEPLHPELHHSTKGSSTRPRWRTTDIHSRISQLHQDAVVKINYCGSTPGGANHQGGTGKDYVAHFQHLHPPHQLLH